MTESVYALRTLTVSGALNKYSEVRSGINLATIDLDEV